MDIEEKLQILADSAKYDASCSSSGSRRKIRLMELEMEMFLVFAIVGVLMVDVFLCLKF